MTWVPIAASAVAAGPPPTSALMRSLRDNAADTRARFSAAVPAVGVAEHTQTGKHSSVGFGLFPRFNGALILWEAVGAITVGGSSVAWGQAISGLDQLITDEAHPLFGSYSGIYFVEAATTDPNAPNAGAIFIAGCGVYGDGRRRRYEALNLSTLTTTPARAYASVLGNYTFEAA